MVACSFDGNADMYGLGIRLGYYLQWYGGLFASLIAQSEVPTVRFALALFIAATFLALIIQTAENNLQVAEIYIILLLTFGAWIFLVPLFLWRIVTGFRAEWDPSKFPFVDPGPTHSDLHTPLLLAVAGYELWFWFSRVPTLDNLDCEQYGFLFTKIRLNNNAFEIINIILYFLLAIIVLLFFVLRVVSLTNDPEQSLESARSWERRMRRQWGSRRLWRRIRILKILDFLNKLITVTIIVIATELTIKWNNITGIDSLNSAGQLIPFLIGLGIVVRILYVGLRRLITDDDDDDEYVQTKRRIVPLPGYQLPQPMTRESISLPDDDR